MHWDRGRGDYTPFCGVDTRDSGALTAKEHLVTCAECLRIGRAKHAEWDAARAAEPLAETRETRLARFLALYEPALLAAVRAAPKDYAWPESEVPTVARQMVGAIDRRAFNKDSRAIRAVCKALGIKHTYKAIEAWLASGVYAEPCLALAGTYPDRRCTKPRGHAGPHVDGPLSWKDES